MRRRERLDRVQLALRDDHWDFLVCALPKNVLLLSGYWPVVGTGVAIASADGQTALLVPEDEETLAQSAWADVVQTFQPSSLDRLITAEEAIRAPLRKLVGSLAPGIPRIGFEAGETSEPASYAAMHRYGGAMRSLLSEIFPGSTLMAADGVLADLRSKKTEFEIEQLRVACEIAGKAFVSGSRQIKVGDSEVETATQSVSLSALASGPSRNSGARMGSPGACREVIRLSRRQPMLVPEPSESSLRIWCWST
ncbi:MAG TPA: aminopeptidase P family N-terminal domain-containing protein [Humisphaera sp.]|nr:aminopeptidase P family N-terminal domain-containing protein [Humisphaera sp.]